MQQQHKILITKPCTKNWDAMQPTAVGRHCNSCKKDVVDFTLLNDDEVKNYLLNNIGKETCGRFYHHQIDRIKIVLPQHILHSKIARWKKFVIVLMVCFGVQLFSIEVSFGQTIDSTQKVDTTRKDTIMGDGVLDSFDVEKKVDYDSLFVDTILMGDFEPQVVKCSTGTTTGFVQTPKTDLEDIMVVSSGTFVIIPNKPLLDTSINIQTQKKEKNKKSKIPNKKLPPSNPSFLPEEIFTLNRRKKSK